MGSPWVVGLGATATERETFCWLTLDAPQDHWLPGFNFNVEEWDAKGQTYETPAICHALELPAPCLLLRSRRSPPAGS